MDNNGPILLCLNARREHCGVAADGADWVVCARAALQRARARNWRVGHLYEEPPRPFAGRRGSIAGLEPLVGEPVSRVRAPNWRAPWLDEWITRAMFPSVYALGVCTASLLDGAVRMRDRKIANITVLVDAGTPLGALEGALSETAHGKARLANTSELFCDGRASVVVDLAQRRAVRFLRENGG